jgi:hypothetical protein
VDDCASQVEACLMVATTFLFFSFHILRLCAVYLQVGVSVRRDTIYALLVPCFTGLSFLSARVVFIAPWRWRQHFLSPKIRVYVKRVCLAFKDTPLHLFSLHRLRLVLPKVCSLV